MIQKKEEWVVLRDGVVWTDRLNSESECLYHIQYSVETDEIFNENDYTYRKMTNEETLKYEKW